jgi:hypothetical protein
MRLIQEIANWWVSFLPCGVCVVHRIWHIPSLHPNSESEVDLGAMKGATEPYFGTMAASDYCNYESTSHHSQLTVHQEDISDL